LSNITIGSELLHYSKLVSCIVYQRNQSYYKNNGNIDHNSKNYNWIILDINKVSYDNGVLTSK